MGAGESLVLYEGLSVKERLFLDRWLVHFNAGRAYREAFNPSNVSDAAVVDRGRRLLQRKRVRSYIVNMSAESSHMQRVIREEVDKALMAIALTPITDIASFDDENGLTLKSSDEIDPRQALAISKVKVTRKQTEHGEDVTKEISMVDKNPAVTNLLKRHGLMKQPDQGEMNLQINVVNHYKKGRDSKSPAPDR